jgi:Triose-phosphate Transporter family
LLWCASSSFYFILLKSILNFFPYPIFLTAVVLGTQTLYSFLRWELGISKGPSFSKLRRRHVTRLLWAALLHGMATLALNHCVLAGPLTLTILLKMLPFSYSVASLLQWGISLAMITNAKHLTLALLANLGFAARSQIRTSTHRFHGGHNVFQLTVALSFLIPTLPLYFCLEHNHVIFHWQTANVDNNQTNTHFPTFWIGLLGVLYCIGNDLGAVVPQFDIHRRLVTWAFGALLLGENLGSMDVIGAFSVILLQLYRKRYDTKPSQSTLMNSSDTSRRNRTHSGESFGSTSWNSIRSF